MITLLDLPTVEADLVRLSDAARATLVWRLTPDTYGTVCALRTLRDISRMAQGSYPEASNAEYANESLEAYWRLRCKTEEGLPSLPNLLGQINPQLLPATKQVDALKRWGTIERIAYDTAFAQTVNLYKWW